MTEGRDLGPPTLWNAWAQPLFVHVSDERYGLDMETKLGGVTIGLDRRFGENVVIGASIAVQNSSTDGFDKLLQAEIHRIHGRAVSRHSAVTSLGD